METLETIIATNRKISRKNMWSIARQQAELAVDIAVFLDYESQEKTDALAHLNEIKDRESLLTQTFTSAKAQ